MTKKTVGKVKKTSTSETNSGEKFGIKLETDDGENWYNGWGSLPEGVKEGAKVQIPYELNESNGNIYRNIEDKDAIDILEEGETSSESSSSSSSSNESFDRQNAIKTAGQIFKGKGKLDAEELQQFKVLVEELDNYNQEGKWDSLEEVVADRLVKGKDEEKQESKEDASEEVLDSSSKGSSDSDPSSNTDTCVECGPDLNVDDELQEEMKKAVEENSEGDDVIFGEGEEGDEE